MVDLGDAKITIKADDKASAKMARIGKSADAMGAKFKKVGKIMTGVGLAVTAALTAIVVSTAKAGDEIQKMALKTKFSTESLSRWRHVLELGGTDLSVLEKAVKKMSKTIVDAGDGLETYIRVFRKLGIEVKSLAGLTPEEQFDKLFMALANVTDQTVQMALAQDLFGRSGMALLPTLEQGAEAIAEMRAETKEVFTQEMADRAAAFNDVITVLKDSLKGVAMTVAGSLMPRMQGFIQQVTSIVEKVSAWTEAHPQLTGILLKTGLALGVLLSVLGPLLIMMPGIIATVGILTGAMSGLAVATGIALLPLYLLIAALAVLGVGIVLLMQNWGRVVIGMRRTVFDIQNFFMQGFGAIEGFIMNVTEGVLNLVRALQNVWAMLMQFMGLGRPTRGREPEPEPPVEPTEPTGPFRRPGVIPSPEPTEPGGGMTSFQHGGIVTQPITARLGENAPAIPEAVIPLDQAGALPLESTVTTQINLEGEVLAEVVSKHLGEATLSRQRIGG